MKMERNRGPAAIVIARYGWKKNLAVRENHSWNGSPPTRRRDTRRRVPNIRRAAASLRNTSTHHDASICFLIPDITALSSMPVMVSKLHPLETLLRERIVLLDGAMGTMIQRYKLSEADYRGKRFRDWKGKDLKGSLELL